MQTPTDQERAAALQALRKLLARLMAQALAARMRGEK
jgi:hypothetical protein